MRLTPAQRRKVYLTVADTIREDVEAELDARMRAESYPRSMQAQSWDWWFTCGELQDELRNRFGEEIDVDDQWSGTDLTVGPVTEQNLEFWFPEFALFRPKRVDSNAAWWGQRYADHETRIAVLQLCAEMTKGA
jgi:hypothetical protein